MKFGQAQDIARYDVEWKSTGLATSVNEHVDDRSFGYMHEALPDGQSYYPLLTHTVEEARGVGKGLLYIDPYANVRRNFSERLEVGGVKHEHEIQRQSHNLSGSVSVSGHPRKDNSPAAEWADNNNFVFNPLIGRGKRRGYKNVECGFCDHIGHETEECFYNPLGHKYKPGYKSKAEKQLLQRLNEPRNTPKQNRRNRKHKSSSKKRGANAPPPLQSRGNSCISKHVGKGSGRTLNEAIGLGARLGRMYDFRHDSPAHSSSCRRN